jgi:hypothetical protein
LVQAFVVHVNSCSLVLVSHYEHVATVRDFYTKDANARLNWRVDLIHYTLTHDNHWVLG